MMRTSEVRAATVEPLDLTGPAEDAGDTASAVELVEDDEPPPPPPQGESESRKRRTHSARVEVERTRPSKTRRIVRKVFLAMLDIAWRAGCACGLRGVLTRMRRRAMRTREELLSWWEHLDREVAEEVE